MKKLALLLVVMFATMTLSAGVALSGALDDIQKRGTLRVGMEPGYMPFELTNKKGEIIGFDVDMAQRMRSAYGKGHGRKTRTRFHCLGWHYSCPFNPKI